MKRRIENPKILLLDCNLEYKKGESQTNIEIMKEEDFSKILEMEESYIKRICDDIIRYSPDLVKTVILNYSRDLLGSYAPICTVLHIFTV